MTRGAQECTEVDGIMTEGLDVRCHIAFWMGVKNPVQKGVLSNRGSLMSTTKEPTYRGADDT